MTEQRRRRTIQLPPPSEVDHDDVAAFLQLLGYDDKTQGRITSVRLNSRRVAVDVRGRADVKLTVTHPVVWEDDQ